MQHARSPLPPSAAAQSLRLSLTDQGEVMGELLLGRRSGEEDFSPADRRLLRDMARQASAAVHVVRLTDELQRSDEHFAAARERLITAREEERRGMRHGLRDGLEPQLAGRRCSWRRRAAA